MTTSVGLSSLHAEAADAGEAGIGGGCFLRSYDRCA
jgi:hypothetical protein